MARNRQITVVPRAVRLKADQLESQMFALVVAEQDNQTPNSKLRDLAEAVSVARDKLDAQILATLNGGSR